MFRVSFKPLQAHIMMVVYSVDGLQLSFLLFQSQSQTLYNGIPPTRIISIWIFLQLLFFTVLFYFRHQQRVWYMHTWVTWYWLLAICLIINNNTYISLFSLDSTHPCFFLSTSLNGRVSFLLNCYVPEPPLYEISLMTNSIFLRYGGWR